MVKDACASSAGSINEPSPSVVIVVAEGFELGELALSYKAPQENQLVQLGLAFKGPALLEELLPLGTMLFI